MRVLLIAQFYAPLMGGIERHVQSLAAGLVAFGHDVAVVTFWHPDLPEFELDGQVRVHRIRATVHRMAGLYTGDRLHAPPAPDPEALRAIWRIIQQENPDIIHAHNWLTHCYLPLRLLRKTKLVRSLHDSSLSCVQMRMMFKGEQLCDGPGARCLPCAQHHYGALKGTVTLAAHEVMTRLERKLVDVFLPVSQAIADSNRLDPRKATFEVIPNFVPDAVEVVAGPLDARVAALPERYILQVGDLSRDKGIEVLLAAYRQMRDPPPLVLVGRRVADSPVDLPPGVILIEGMPHAAIMQAWQRALFGVVASTCLDASPTVTLEAMACGKPVVGSRIGGIPDQIRDGVCGLLVPSGDAPALQAAMSRLLEDTSAREAMGAASLRRVAEFRSSRVVRRIEAVYRSLLQPA